jgi:hypothetical protein
MRDGQVCATGFVKGATVGRGGLIPNARLYSMLGYENASLQLPDDLCA